MVKQVVFVSATPAEYELQKSKGRHRGTGHPPHGPGRPAGGGPAGEEPDRRPDRRDPHPGGAEGTDARHHADKTDGGGSDRIPDDIGVKVRYIHSEVDALERVEILRDLRLGDFDVLVGVNLLREGLDLPEVSLVAILDADKEGFLRSERSLIQTAGRTARNLNGIVILYADTVTGSMQRMMDETRRRRDKQLQYNRSNNISPTTVYKTIDEVLAATAVADVKAARDARRERAKMPLVADSVIRYLTRRAEEGPDRRAPGGNGACREGSRVRTRRVPAR